MVRKLNLDAMSYISIPLFMRLKETGAELAKGTGFLYKDADKYYLITNWHNVTGINPRTGKQLGSHGGVPDLLEFKLQVQKEPFIKWNSFFLELYSDSGISEWFIHPIYGSKVDVVAIEVEFGSDFNAILRPINDFSFYDVHLNIADDVFILGYPFDYSGGGRFPIWKRGSIATEPDININDLPMIYVDTASRPGMSGSPVIFRRAGLHWDRSTGSVMDSVVGDIRSFVGIYSGRIKGIDDLDAQLGIVWKSSVIDEIIKGGVFENRSF